MEQNELLITTTYMIYLVLSIVITVWVGRSLHHNGRLFLVVNFHGNEALRGFSQPSAVGRFLQLINIGFVSLALKYGEKPSNIYQVIEFLSTKVGLVIVVLGAALLQYLCLDPDAQLFAGKDDAGQHDP